MAYRIALPPQITIQLHAILQSFASLREEVQQQKGQVQKYMSQVVKYNNMIRQQNQLLRQMLQQSRRGGET